MQLSGTPIVGDAISSASSAASNSNSVLPRLPGVLRIYAGKIFDSEDRKLTSNQVISVSTDSGLILSVTGYNPSTSIEPTNDIIDLRGATLLPGFVDAHVHFFLHPYAETTWEDQLTKESLVERTVRATVHAKQTLLAGYTAVRDLGTEGAGDADIALRKCVSGSSPLISGPRYFCASRALVCTGSYGPKSSLFPNQEGVDGITGAEVADGPSECIKAVRRQVGAGADWIKVYADYRARSRMADVAPVIAHSTIPTFSREELDAIIFTAAQLGVKVAAHASDWRRVVSLPFHTLEHGNESFPDIPRASGAYTSSIWESERLGSGKTIWVPTLSAYFTTGGSRWTQAQQTFRAALSAGFDNIACGGDTGVFAHGDNALEMQLMFAAGAPWQNVLAWATIGGWKCIRHLTWEGHQGQERLARVGTLSEDYRIVGDNEVPFGLLRRGFAADIIATTGDLEHDFANAVSQNNITFVMKGGRVYKRDGKETA